MRMDEKMTIKKIFRKFINFNMRSFIYAANWCNDFILRCINKSFALFWPVSRCVCQHVGESNMMKLKSDSEPWHFTDLCCYKIELFPMHSAKCRRNSILAINRIQSMYFCYLYCKHDTRNSLNNYDMLTANKSDKRNYLFAN